MVNVWWRACREIQCCNQIRHGNSAVVMQCNLKVTTTGESEDENNGEKSR